VKFGEGVSSLTIIKVQRAAAQFYSRECFSKGIEERKQIEK